MMSTQSLPASLSLNNQAIPGRRGLSETNNEAALQNPENND